MKNIRVSIFLFTICLAALVTHINAQVTIGSSLDPGKGAILDLKEEGTTTKGLGMPRVELKESDSLKMGNRVIANVGDAWARHAGLMVYNTNKCFDKGGDGLYVWNGSQWQRLPERDKYIDALFQPNSYWVTPGTTTVKIPVEKAFRIWEYYGRSEGKNRLPSELVEGELTPVLYWQDAPIVLSPASLSISGNNREDVITVTLAGGTVKGNAVIGLKDGSGTIRWSWHIWVTDDPTTSNLNGGRFTWMDRNLGATSAGIMGEEVDDLGTIGLTYQWGRKDPFPMSESWNNTEPILQSGHGELVTAVDKNLTNNTTAQNNFKNSIIQPLSFIKASSSYPDWYRSSMSPEDPWDERWDRTEEGCFHKSPFDPCPEGWRVPAHQYNENGKAINTTNPWQDIINGTATQDSPHEYLRTWDGFGTYPFSGYRHYQSGLIISNSVSGYVWSASTANNTENTGNIYKAYTLFFHRTNGTKQQSELDKAWGFSVRCVRE